MSKIAAGKNYTWLNQYFVTPWDIQKYVEEFADEIGGGPSGVTPEQAKVIAEQVVQLALQNFKPVDPDVVNEMISNAINEYLANNPVNGITESQARDIVSNAISADNVSDVTVTNDSVASGVKMKVEYLVED